MNVYKEQSSNFIQQTSLWESLGLSHLSHGIVSLVGGGGKTSVMYRLARELEAMGKRVIVTTSTHIFYTQEYQTVIVEDVSLVKNVDWKGGILVVGGQVTKEGKLKGLPASVTHQLSAYCDVLLIEADGAKHLPVKLPAAHEPVIINETDVVIACAGLDCIGRTWAESCFRWKLAAEIVGVDGNDIIEPKDLAEVLLSEQGSRKGVGERLYRIVLNKADDDVRLACAMQVCEELRKYGETDLAVTCFLEPGKGVNTDESFDQRSR